MKKQNGALTYPWRSMSDSHFNKKPCLSTFQNSHHCCSFASERFPKLPHHNFEHAPLSTVHPLRRFQSLALLPPFPSFSPSLPLLWCHKPRERSNAEMTSVSCGDLPFVTASQKFKYKCCSLVTQVSIAKKCGNECYGPTVRPLCSANNDLL